MSEWNRYLTILKHACLNPSVRRWREFKKKCPCCNLSDTEPSKVMEHPDSRYCFQCQIWYDPHTKKILAGIS